MQAIESAIESLGRDRFRDQFWDKSVAYVPGQANSREELHKILDQISEFLDRTDIRYPSLRLVKDGSELPLEDYTRELRIGPHLSHDWIINESIFQQYQNGSTIVLQMLQNSLPSFGCTANRMEEYFEASVQVSCFITPPNAQGFTAHYDTYSFFAVQLYGEKRWSLYNATEQLPIRDDRDKEASWNPVPPEQELTLHAGDVMYVPRGRYHSALTSSTASIHLTIGIFSPNWIDAAKASFTETQASLPLRQSIPELKYSGTTEMDVSLFEDLLRSQVDLKAGVRKLKNQVFEKHVDSRIGRLTDLLLLSKNEQPLSYRRQLVPYRLKIQNNQAVLQFANKEIGFPEFVSPVLVAICEQPTYFRALNLPSTLDHPSMQVLLKRLVSEGFLSATAYSD